MLNNADSLPSDISTENENISGTQGFWQREWPVLLFLALAIPAYFTQLTTLTLRGEETRRGRISWEMVHTGDWLVPKLQGEPRLTRPPMHNWAIAIVGVIWGDVDSVAVRFPSSLAVVLTGVLIYWYSRQFLSPLGSFAAAMAFATFGQVMQLGRLGESEAIFTLFLAGALLIWHSGYIRKWSPLKLWLITHAFMVIAMLTKGPQAPVYFAGAVAAYLILKGDWRFGFSWQHACGILLSFLVLCGWLVPFYLQEGPELVQKTFFGEVGKRLTNITWLEYAEHLVTYPLEILAACLMPWSIFLIAFAFRSFRNTIGTASDSVRFIVICLLVSFPTVWFPAESNTRYFMPLYPCFAILIGIVIERLWQMSPAMLSEATGSTIWNWQMLWKRFSAFVLGVTVLAIPPLFLVRFIWPPIADALPIFMLLTLALTIVIAAAVMFSLRNSFHQKSGLISVALAGLLLGTTYNGIVIPLMAMQANDVGPAVAEIKDRMPEDANLVGLSLVHHPFTFFWKDELLMRVWPETGDDCDDIEYFCFHHHGADRPVPELPFKWEVIGSVNCDRNRSNTPYDLVIVGKRIKPSDEQNSVATQIAISDLKIIH